MPQDELLTVAQVAQRWQVSVRTVQRYIAEGKIKALRLPGGQYRVRAEDADAALDETPVPTPCPQMPTEPE